MKPLYPVLINENVTSRKMRPMETPPRVLQLWLVRVSFWVWHTSKMISSPTKIANSITLTILQKKLRLSPVYSTTNMCRAWVINSRNSCAMGEQVKAVMTTAYHQSSPKRQTLQNCYAQDIELSFQIFLWTNLKKIQWQRLEQLTERATSSFFLRIQNKWKRGYRVARMKATTADAMLKPPKVLCQVAVLASVNWRVQAKTKVRNWQKTRELKQKQGLLWKVTLKCLLILLVKVSYLDTYFFIRQNITPRQIKSPAKTTPMLQIFLKKLMSVRYWQRQVSVLQQSSRGRGLYHEEGIIATFWFWTSLKPVRTCRRRAGAVRAARQMCSHIFWKLCMRWVVMVCSPNRNMTMPPQMTILDMIWKKVLTPLMADWSFTGENLVRLMELWVLSTILELVQVGLSNLAKKGSGALTVSFISVITSSGKRHSKVILPLMTSFEGKALRKQTTVLLDKIQQLRGTLLTLRTKICLNKLGSDSLQVLLNATTTFRAQSQLQSILNVKGQVRQDWQPTGYTFRLFTPKTAVEAVLVVLTNQKQTVKVLLVEKNSMLQKERKSVTFAEPPADWVQSWLPNEEQLLLAMRRSLRQISSLSVDCHWPTRIRQNQTIDLQCCQDTLWIEVSVEEERVKSGLVGVVFVLGLGVVGVKRGREQVAVGATVLGGRVRGGANKGVPMLVLSWHPPWQRKNGAEQSRHVLIGLLLVELVEMELLELTGVLTILQSRQLSMHLKQYQLELMLALLLTPYP